VVGGTARAACYSLSGRVVTRRFSDDGDPLPTSVAQGATYGLHRSNDDPEVRVGHEVVHPFILARKAAERGVLQDHPITLPP